MMRDEDSFKNDISSDSSREEYRLREMEIEISRKRMENDFNLKKEELEIQRKVSDNPSMFSNPVFLAALIGAITAALANAYVAWMNNNTMLDIETHKENEEQAVEERKAEFSRLLEISKLDLETAKQKLQAFVDWGLITDPKIRAGSIAVSQKNVDNSTNQNGYVTVMWSSGWVGGGHNQDEMCNAGISALKVNEQYKVKTISKLFASEDSRKDFLGHVEYNYHCTYRVSSN